MSSYFFIGRSERIVIAILVIIAVTALGLYAWSRRGRAVAEGRALSLEQEHRSQSAGKDTIYKDEHYVGPPSYLRKGASAKFAKRVVLDLNKVDSVTLIRVPGIGGAFARRILSLREKLGGYYTVMQLQEVYGIDEDKYLALRPWFAIKTPPRTYLLSSLRAGELPKHLYLSWEQQRAMNRLIYRYGQISSWKQLMATSAFVRDDSIRLSPYFVEQAPASSLEMDSLHKNSGN